MIDQAVMTRTPADAAAHNGELLRAGYAAFARGDLAAIQALFSPDIVWHAQRLGVLGGDHRGWQAVAQFFGRSMEMTQGTFHIDVLDVLTNETSSAALVRSQGRRGDATLDDRQIHLFRIENDLVTEVWQYVGDGPATEAFWS